MSSLVKNYLRTHRKRSGLRQDDIAFLLDLNGGYGISRYERLERIPSLDTAFGMQVLFDTLPHELYPGLYAKVERITRRRIRTLIRNLERESSGANTTFQREFLMEVITRSGSRRSRL
jgi:transcriptional regulator with XRE-family HTH domain